MIEDIVINYLNSKIDVNTYAEIPENTEDYYIIVEKTNEYIEDHIIFATITIQSYGPSLYQSAVLNNQMIDEMLKITESTNVQMCNLNSSYNYTDTSKKKYRYQAVFDISY